MSSKRHVFGHCIQLYLPFAVGFHQSLCLSFGFVGFRGTSKGIQMVEFSAIHHQPKITKISSHLEIHEEALILNCLETVDFRLSDVVRIFIPRRMTIDIVFSDFGGFVGFQITNPHIFRSHSIDKFTNVGFSIAMLLLSGFNCISHLQEGYT